VRLAAGTYELTLISTVGPNAADTATGTLHLYAARPSDRSPPTGQAPSPDERSIHIPLWGYTTADLRRVGAPLPDRATDDIPQPDSEDPIFPGVIVLIRNWNNPSLPQENTLWIASGANIRADLGYAVLDGPGIVLNIRTLDD
jgi:hypothetical protein